MANGYSFRIIVGLAISICAASWSGTASASTDWITIERAPPLFERTVFIDKVICDCLIVEAPRIQDERVTDNLRLAALPNLKRAVFDGILIQAALLDHRRIHYDAS